MIELIKKLENREPLTVKEYKRLIVNRTPEIAEILAEKADKIRREIYGNTVYIRGLIEVSNICKNDCFYCGIRRSNKNCERYRLSGDEILECCSKGYGLGFRTFVLQGGEDVFFTDNILCEIIKKIKTAHPDCDVTLSLGERSEESYRNLFAAGADRYLLRHETADCEHYGKLHPQEMSFDTRMSCLETLKKIGFQVGCGFMVGSPFQTAEMLARDLKFIETFKPDMCGTGPFIPHKDTPFADFSGGTAELTCYLLSIIRLIHPEVLLPSTTALGTISKDGRENGILSGANVVMPNLSPSTVRKKYELYNNKLSDGDEAAESVENLKQKMKSIGYEIVIDRGDRKSMPST